MVLVVLVVLVLVVVVVTRSSNWHKNNDVLVLIVLVVLVLVILVLVVLVLIVVAKGSNGVLNFGIMIVVGMIGIMVMIGIGILVMVVVVMVGIGIMVIWIMVVVWFDFVGDADGEASKFIDENDPCIVCRHPRKVCRAAESALWFGIPDFVIDLSEFSAVYADSFDEFIGALEESVFEYTGCSMSNECISFHFTESKSSIVLFASKWLMSQWRARPSCTRSKFVEYLRKHQWTKKRLKRTEGPKDQKRFYVPCAEDVETIRDPRSKVP